jgi:hypothetical protein
MCIIVDADVAARVLLSSNDEKYGRLHKALFGSKRPRATLIYGGQLAREYRLSSAFKRALAELDRAARARTVPDSTVDAEAVVLLRCA